MAQLYFYYSAMNAGKSTHLLQANYNYLERGLNTVLLTAEIANRKGTGIIDSRLGIDSKAHTFDKELNIFHFISNLRKGKTIDCILIDEAQFLKKKQVAQICKIVDQLNIPVLAYGLRTDFIGKLFEGSKYLLAWADKFSEIKSICHSGKKATMVLRLDKEGNPVKSGDQVSIGGNESYISVSRKEFTKYIDLENS